MSGSTTTGAIISETKFSMEQTTDNVIRDVLLCGNASRNGYAIPSAAFGSEANAKSLYEGTPVFFDHFDQKRLKHPNERSAEDISGVIRNVRLRDGKPYGDIEVIDSDKGRSLMSVIRTQPRGYGLSHVARYALSKDRKMVTAITEVLSVDVVLNPATTKNFYEVSPASEEDDISTESETIKDLKYQLEKWKDLALKADGEAAVLRLEAKYKDARIASLEASKRLGRIHPERREIPQDRPFNAAETLKQLGSTGNYIPCHGVVNEALGNIKFTGE